jgi:ribokinase
VQNATWDVVVVGGVNSDFMVRGGTPPAPGQTIPGREFYEGPGGKGANQAVAAARLGARVALVARVGKDERGEKMRRHLAGEGVDVRHVTHDDGATTGAALVWVDDDGEKRIVSVAGANERLTPEEVHAAADTLRQSRVVLMALEVPLACVQAAAEIVASAGVRVVLDPAPPPEDARLLDALLKQTYAVKPNAHEAEALTGIAVKDRGTARQAAERLRERGAEAVAVQVGSEGNLFVASEGERFVPNLPVKRVDATGAGDAFAATLAVQTALGKPFLEAGPFASAAAALTTTALGAQPPLPRKEDILALLARNGYGECAWQ